MIRLIAIIFGVAFVFIGVAGFMPAFASQNSMLQNMAYIVSGVVAIMSATHIKLTQLYFLIAGIIYIVAAALGFGRHGDLFIIHVTTSDNFLHLAIGITFVYLAYYTRRQHS
jgi:hypothetical protein